MVERLKILLDENDAPDKWYNINSDLPKPLPPPLNSQTNEPITPDDLAPLFPMSLLGQEMSQDRWIPIPEEVRDIYRIWRPTSLYRATKLEEALGTPAKIFYKNEGESPPGSHKPNTAVAQAYYNREAGTEVLSTETGAGQWGSALAFACNLLGLECKVFMVKVSYNQKPYRRVMMETWNAKVTPSPSTETNSGKKILGEMPDHPGSLGLAISEAAEYAAVRDNTKYSLGSVLNHVLLHQTVIGIEAKAQLAAVDEYPDLVIGCVGGGSNFSGIAYPFIGDKLRGEKEVKTLAVEPSACPTMTSGEYKYDFGDTVELAPLLKMYTLGHTFIPDPIHAGGLRYHGASYSMSMLANEGFIDAVAYHQLEIFEAARTFMKYEGLLPAPETAHAIKAVIDQALECKETGEEKTILFNFSGHGYFDLQAYDDFNNGKLKDY